MQMNLNRSWNLAAIVLLATACGGTPTGSIATPSPSSEATATPVSATPSPVAGACHPCLALVTLRGSNQLVVRDITDISHARTISTLASLSAPQFVNATELSYLDYSSNSIVRVPLGGSPKSIVASSNQFAGYVDWSPDATADHY